MLMLYDDENTFIRIVSSCYDKCIEHRNKRGLDTIPDYSEISDECMEFTFDNSIHSVTINGMGISRYVAIDTLLKGVLEAEGFVFRYDGYVINPAQIIMFEELYYGEDYNATSIYR